MASITDTTRRGLRRTVPILTCRGIATLAAVATAGSLVITVPGQATATVQINPSLFDATGFASQLGRLPGKSDPRSVVDGRGAAAIS